MGCWEDLKHTGIKNQISNGAMFKKKQWTIFSQYKGNVILNWNTYKKN